MCCVEWMAMEYWKDTDGVRPKYSEKSPSLCHFIHHMDRRGNERQRPRLEVGD
jgi:hypothetical protein